MSFLRRWEIPILLGSIPGIVITANYFLNAPEIGLRDISGFIETTATVVGAVALFYGVLLGVNHQFRSFSRRTGYWYFNGMAVVLFAIMMITGLSWPFTQHPVYKMLFDNVVVPLGSALYALRAFYIFSGAFRAFICRNKEATVLVVTAILVIIGNTPMSASVWTGFSAIGEWLNQYPTTGGMRGFTIGVGVGAAVLGIRTLLGRERAQLGLE